MKRRLKESKRRSLGRHLIESLEVRQLLSVNLLADINQVPTSTTALGQLVNNNGTLFFIDNDGVTGTELWKSDGTAAGTSLVKDLYPGSGSSSPTSLAAANGFVYFDATDGINGTGLYQSDGTSAGTVRITTNGAYLSGAYNFVLLNGSVYFLGNDSSGSVYGSLWKISGTTAVEVKNVDNGYGFYGRTMSVFNGALYLSNGGSSAGSQLLKSDGTAAGTTVVKTLTGSTVIANLTVAGSRLYFTDNGNQLWTSDGTAAGTVALSTIGTGSSIGILTPLGNGVIFSANDGLTGNELWSSNGSSAGLLKDIFPGTGSSTPSYLTGMGGKVYFAANDSVHGNELWSTDGTAGNTAIVADLSSGSTSSYTVDLGAVGNRLYFWAAGSSGSPGVWSSDGTAAGTTLMHQFPNYNSTLPVPGAFAALGTRAIFPATDPTTGTELWTSTGTSASTQLVDDIYHGSGDSEPTFGPTLNNKLYFTANDGVNKLEVWTTDGTTAGTSMLYNLNASGGRSFNSFVGVSGSYLYMDVFNPRGTNYYELWRTDGTATGTIELGAYGGYASSLVTVGGKSLFIASSTLYSTDGTVAGTRGITTNGISSLSVVLNGIAYGSGGDGTHGIELWRSDGTATGTYMVSDLAPGTNSSSPTQFSVLGNRVVFFASTSSSPTGYDLWSTDGTTAGTTDLYPANWYFGGAGISNGKLFFSGSAGQLYASDGTAAGTGLVTRINLTPGGSSTPGNIVDLNGVALFWATGQNGSSAQLYRSDGTAAGTYLVKNVFPTLTGFPEINSWAQLNGAWYFMASPPRVNNFFAAEGLWRTDGTAAGTYEVGGVSPGMNGSDESCGTINGKILYAADDQIRGDEPWVYTNDAVPITTVSTTYTPATSGLAFTFNFSSAAATVGPAVVRLQNLTAGSTPPTAVETVMGGRLSLAFPTGTTLPDGNYQVIVPPGSIADANGNPNSDTYTYSFYVLAGDANGDRHVDAADLAVVNADMGKTNQTYAQGDFNGDGSVTSADLAIAMANLNVWLPAPGETILPVSTGDNALLFREDTRAGIQVVDIFAGAPIPSAPTYQVYLGAVTALDFVGGAGNDSVTIDNSRGVPLPVLNFNGGSGVNTLTIEGQTGGHAVTFTQNAVVFDTATTMFSNVSNVVFDPAPDNYYIGSYTLSVTGVKVSLARLAVGSGTVTAPFGKLTIGTGGELDFPVTNNANGTIDNPDRYVMITNTSTVSGLLDLGDSDWMSTGQTESAIRAMIQPAYAFGTWVGATGVTSTVAAASKGLIGLAVTLNQTPAGTRILNQFDDLNPNSNYVLVKTTYVGDANLDGKVDGSDYALIDAGYVSNGSSTGWYAGDFNYDGLIDGSDYALIDNAFNNQSTVVPSAVAAAIPNTSDMGTGAAKISSPARVRSPGTLPVASAMFSNAPIELDSFERRKHKPSLLTFGSGRGRESVSVPAPDPADSSHRNLVS